MPAIALLFLVAGGFVLRQVLVGRAMSIPTDAKDGALALLSGHPEELATVMARRGENVSAEPLVSSGGGSAETPLVGDLTGSIKGGTFAGECRKLGAAAKGYALGTEGPSYYDCSGLLWKAAYLLGLYKGPRWTTKSFTSIASSWCEPVTAPNIGDIVLWANSHMGVCTGNDLYYSAKSPTKGILESSISGDISFFGRQPTYWRIK